MLEVRNIDVAYGEVPALRDVTLAVGEGESVAVLGANGAGKSTLLRTISGLLRPRKGSVTLDETRLDQLAAYDIAALGIAHVPEGRRVLPEMTVEENLELGAYLPRPKARRRESRAWIYQIFPRLAERRRQRAGTLSGGEQQMLAIGRSLMSAPRVLLLDEPSMGLAPILVEQIFDIVKEINARGTTVLLVEQNALMALAIANRGYILQTGEIVLADQAEALARNPAVRAAYLGGD